jgi:hypothetical protein
MKDMKKPRLRRQQPKRSEEFSGVVCEVCGAPFKPVQTLNLPVAKGAVPFGSWVPTCKCKRPAPPPPRPFDPDIPF